MITDMDLRAAIAECEGSRNPTASTCVKLAAYYAILNQRSNNPAEPTPQYSYASEPDIINYGDSEFSRLVQRKTISRCFPVLEEMMQALLVVDPKLYHNTMRKLESV